MNPLDPNQDQVAVNQTRGHNALNKSKRDLTNQPVNTQGQQYKFVFVFVFVHIKEGFEQSTCQHKWWPIYAVQSKIIFSSSNIR